MTPGLLRPMRPEDVPIAERLSAIAFFELDRRLTRPIDPEPGLRPETRAGNWITRTLHLLETDPGGCWVAEQDGELVGMVTSLKRELMWILATYAVRPGVQGQGIGKALLDAALTHGRDCLRGMFASSADPAAVRRYRAAGFTLHPQMYLRGTLDRSAIPVIDKVREGTPADFDLMDSVDRATRGAAHGTDHQVMFNSWPLLVSDTSTGQGYVYTGGGVALLAATNRQTARRLLWAAIAESEGEVTVPHLTVANEWAIDVGHAARLELHQEGYLALRGMRPPAPYIHNGALL